MTIAQLCEKLDVPVMARMVAQTALALKGLSFDDTIGFEIDRAAGRLRVSIADTLILDTTFDQVEAAVCDDRPGVAVDGGDSPGGSDLAGT